MFHHIVFFYLKKDLTAAQRAEFEAKLRGLLAIKSIHSGYVGIPSLHAVRPIIDTSYDFAEYIETVLHPLQNNSSELKLNLCERGCNLIATSRVTQQ